MENIQAVSDSELILMRIIWESGGTALYAKIVEGLQAKGLEWRKNTIITLLARLVEKGLLKTGKIGRRNEYKALVSEADYNTAQTVSFIDKIYAGDVSGLINTLLQQDMISETEKKALWADWRGSSNGE